MIEVTEQHDDYNKTVWCFNVSADFGDRVFIRLTRFSIYLRQTKRHGWKASRHWASFDERTSTITRSDVPDVPDHVKEQALRLIEFKFFGADR